MSDTNIEWAEKVWNPVTGCTKVSEGCKNCYAEGIFKRFGKQWGYGFNEIKYHYDRFDEPLKWRKPKKIFVCSMGDLFHEDMPDKVISMLFNTMREASHHTFLILTKRPHRMRYYMTEYEVFNYGVSPNIWIGVSAENQEQANRRIPVLLQIPAAKRFVSIEPMLSEISLRWLAAWGGMGTKPREWNKSTNELDGLRELDWVICGGESGPKARPMEYGWAWLLMDQCTSAGVPFFYKQGPDDNGKFTKMPELTQIVWDQVPA